MTFALLYIAAGYLCGSILFARISENLFHKNSMIQSASDKNPGAANAFAYGGFKAGFLTLAGDFLKGFLPVFFYLRQFGLHDGMWAVLVAAAPVLGHIWPVFYHFQGGKGIATTFGVYAAFLCTGISWKPLSILIGLFLLFRFLIRIQPNLYLTAAVYITLPVLCLLADVPGQCLLASVLIGLAVLAKLAASKEPHKPLEIAIWKH